MGKTETASAPGVANWQEELSNLNINTIHKSRTCDIFFMAEQNETCSNATTKFNNGSKIDSTNLLKSINLDDILLNVKTLSEGGTSSNISGDILYQLVAQEVVNNYLNNNEDIPCWLLASLIKLQIIFIVNQDVAKAQQEKTLDNDREKDRTDLIVMEKDVGKGKGKPQDAGKGKGKEKPAVYDVCDSKNALKLKRTSRLKREAKEELPIVQDSVEVAPKHLRLVIVGFYDFNLIKELYNIGVPIVGVLELVKAGCADDSLASSRVGLDEEEQGGEESDDSEKPAFLTPKIRAFESEKSRLLYNFWEKIYENLDSDDACQKYLENIFHMTICLKEKFFDNQLNDQKHCLDVFGQIGTEIIDIPDITRQHVNYIRNLKIIQVGPKPSSQLSSSTLKMYNKIMNIIPPDCRNIFSLVYALIEEVGSRVPDPPRIPETPRSSITSNTSSLTTNTFLNISSPRPQGIKDQIANILKQNINTSFVPESFEYAHDPKLDFKISVKPFLIHENNHLEIMANTYPKLRSKLLDINSEKLSKSLSVLLWNRFPVVEMEKQKIYQLRSIAETLDLPMHELQYVIHTIFFNSFGCSNKNLPNNFCSLQETFPKKTLPASHVSKQNILDKSTFNVELHPREKCDVIVPYVEYLDIPNLYEAKNICSYKWYEALPFLVTIQELFKNEMDYLCFDYKYCMFDDSILLRYHNDVDNFGINTQIWDKSLRTPVSTIREFCRYVIHAEGDWIEKEKEAHEQQLEKELKSTKQDYKKAKSVFYPDLIFTEQDFIQRCSLKGKILEALNAPPELPPAKGGKKGENEGKEKSKDPAGKGKGATAPVSQLILLEKLTKPTPPSPHRKLTLRTAGEEEPFSFYGYDVSENRVQLTGTTTVFHSQDGFKVTVDQTRLIARPRKLSLNICLNGNSLVLHYDQATMFEPLTFHFALVDHTMIVFGKPPKVVSAPEERLGEKICQALKKKKQRRQDVYFVSEKQSSILKCFNIPRVTRKNLVLSEDLLLPFLNQLSLRGIKTKLVPNHTLSLSEIHKFEEALVRKSNEDMLVKHKCTLDIVTETTHVVEEEEPIEEEIVELLKSRKSYKSISSGTTIPPRKTKNLLKKIREAAEKSLPIFKICSSKLHKHQYVKRIKSRVDMEFGRILKRIRCKPRIFKTKIEVEVSKLLPIKPLRSKPLKTNCYDVKICLPSGLLVESVDGTNTQSLFEFRQKYLDKGPQCKKIAKEVSRTFTRNGNVIIKKSNGNIDVYGIGGQNVICELSYLKIKSSMPKKGVTNNLLPLTISSLTKFQRLFTRLRNHLIDGYESQHLKSHKARMKHYIKDPNQIYMLQTSIGNLKKFYLITSDGRKLKVTPSIISEEKKFYTTAATDYRYQEIFYGREDGTHSVLNQESLLITQFADGSRLTSWIEVAREPLLLNKETYDVPSNDKEQQVNDFDFMDSISVSISETEENSENLSTLESEEDSVESGVKFPIDDVGWVMVYLNIKYEHPNYATVIYYGVNNHAEIILPNDVTLNVTDKGEYSVMIDQSIRTNITTQKLLIESHLCKGCHQASFNKINLNPIYKKSLDFNPQEIEFLRTIDTFNKIFVVNYAGECFRNVQYKKGRLNNQRCKMHGVDTQKLYILTRSLLGCKLWNTNSYRNKISNAQRCGDLIAQDEFRTDVKTTITKPYHETFLIPYEQPFLILTKNKPKSHPPKDTSYVVKQVLNNLPTVSKMHQIYSILLELSMRNMVAVSQEAFMEFTGFLTHILDDILGKHVPPESSTVSTETPPIIIRKPGIPFDVRQRKYLELLNQYWKQIREKIVPKYFLSKYYLGEPKTEWSNSDILLCDCFSDLEELTTCECEEEISTSSTEFDGEIIYTPRRLLRHPPPRSPPTVIREKTLTYRPKKFQIETPDDEILVKDITTKIKKLAIEMTDIKSQNVSRGKVECALKKLLDGLKNIDSAIMSDKDAERSVGSILDNLVAMDLNSVELILVLDDFEQEMCLEDKTCSPTGCMAYSKMEESFQDENKLNLSNKSLVNQDEKHRPYFGIYDYYSGEDALLDNTSKGNEKLDAIVQTPIKQQEYCSENSLVEILSSNCQKCIEAASTVDIKTMKYHYSEEKLQFNKYLEYHQCNKCIDIIPKSTLSLDDIKPYRSEVIFNVPIEQNSEETFSEPSNLGTQSSDLLPIIEVSPESSLLEYCLSENLTTVAGHGNTVMLRKNNVEDVTASVMVLFSITSLNEKHSTASLKPYVQTNPNEAAVIMQNIVAETKRKPSSDEQHETNKPCLKKDSSTPLITAESLHNCKKCIMRLDQDAIKNDSFNGTNTKSIASLLSVVHKHTKSDDNVSNERKDKIADSLMDVMEEYTNKSKGTAKYTTGKTLATINDEDARIVADGLPASSSNTVLTAHKRPRQQITRRTVGSQTQQKVEDKNNQTLR